MQRLVFSGHIAGFGTTPVSGWWSDGGRSPRSATFAGTDLRGLAPLLPPVRFGFSSAPPTPQIVAVTTTIDMPVSVD